MTYAERTTQQVHHDELTRHFRRNYLAHIIEGGLYIGGMQFIGATTVMPTMIESLGGPTWLIALAPVLLTLGFVWPPLLMAHRVERWHKVKPFVLAMGVFQRIPLLLSAGALLWWADALPVTTLVIVAVVPLLSGLAGGTGITAWFELVARSIPVHRRASAWAWRSIITAVIGIIAGVVVKSVLAAQPGPVGYGILHVISFGFLVGSYCVFMVIREVPSPQTPEANHDRLWHNLKSIPAMVRGDARLGKYAIMRVLGAGIFVMVPFLAIYARQVTGMGVDYVGLLLLTQMIGSICGSVTAGFVGDRHGGKVLIAASRILFIATCLAAMIDVGGLLTEMGVAPATTALGNQAVFMIVFFLLGMAMQFGSVGEQTLSLEICPLRRRPTYMAFLSTMMFPTLLITAGLSWLLKSTFDEFWPIAMVAMTLQVTSLLFLMRIREPRKENGDATDAPAAA